MKRITGFLLLLLIVASCATKVPYTNQIRDEFELDDASKMKGVQFYTYGPIILEKRSSEGVKTTESDGDLVKSESTTSDRIIIPSSTKCVFEDFTEEGGIIVRFEKGSGKVLRFAMKQNTNLEKYYFVATWKNGKGVVEYGSEEYVVSSQSARAYLVVKIEKWQKEKKKDRVVRGMSVE